MEETDVAVAPIITTSTWAGSYVSTECSLHQLSPYIGKLKSAMAAELINHLSKPGDTIYDPFAGSGTVALEAWLCGRNSIANDLSPYAVLLLRAKLAKPAPEQVYIKKLHRYGLLVQREGQSLVDRQAPAWVSQFFHPTTLQEALAWTHVLRENHEWFLLACLMGILHHQRPGFLSFPASHAVPYLRRSKFPQTLFPQLYEYRPVLERLERKVKRALKRVPVLDNSLCRSVRSTDSSKLQPACQVNAIITSPPYMRRLSYARDNRLRLWFLGIEEPDNLDTHLSPRFHSFMNLMDGSLKRWSRMLVPGGHCALVLGDDSVPGNAQRLPEIIQDLVLTKHQGLRLVDLHIDSIPFERRVRRHASGSKSEAILIFRRD